MHRRHLLAAIVCALPVAAHDSVTTKITWSREVSRIVYARCLSCHREGGAAFALATYTQARPWAKAIKEEVLERRMPPWNAVRGFGHFRNDRGLTLDEISVIADWVEGGAPEGDPQLLPQVPSAEAAAAATRAREVTIAGSKVLARPAHALGVRATGNLQLVAIRPGGAVVPLVWVRRTNAADEGYYWFQAPMRLPAGTRLQATPADAAAVLLVR